MQIQPITEHAIQILRHLHEQQDATHTGTAIAKKVGITYPYFKRLTLKLRQKELLALITQGGSGYYILGRPATEISYYDVFSCIEGELRVDHCQNYDGQCQYGTSSHCKLHEFLKNLQSKIIAEMSEKSIAELV